MKKRIAILGSTGSIGTSALDVISKAPDRFEVVALSAGSNASLLARQVCAFKPKMVSIGSASLAAELKNSVSSRTKVVEGMDGVKEIISRRDIDLVLLAISGTACLEPLVESIRKKKLIALANKEALVSAGALVMKLARDNGVRILPVDSEHSAIFQCLDGRRDALSRIYLTGSGGPLLNVRPEKFDSMARSKVLKHPKWKMGRKITVDSATMMNKGLEIIEAQYLFGVDASRIEVLVHPEAIVHSMVEFQDGAVLAQLATPDMRIPIQYALTYPERRQSHVRKVDFAAIAQLTFLKPDTGKFPCLAMARNAARSGGTAPAVLCAADEEAVRCYLGGEIKFSRIPEVIERVLSKHKNKREPGLTLSAILHAIEWAREEARAICYH